MASREPEKLTSNGNDGTVGSTSNGNNGTAGSTSNGNDGTAVSTSNRNSGMAGSTSNGNSGMAGSTSTGNDSTARSIPNGNKCTAGSTSDGNECMAGSTSDGYDSTAGPSKKQKLSNEDSDYSPSSSGTSITKKQRPSRKIRPPARSRDEEEPSPPQTRSCTIAGCREPQPRCCLQASSNCTRDGYTSRWYHMSMGEHFCNDCFDHFYRTLKPGYPEYRSWSQQWYKISYFKPTLKMFVAENVLPYWLQCTLPNCGKWREFSMEGEPTAEFVRQFTCKTAYKRINKKHCDISEESCVADVARPNWLAKLTEIPFLKRSPAGPYLTMYYSEAIGLSPTTSNTVLINPPKYISPFFQNLNGQSEIWIQPDILQTYEIYYMPKSVMLPSTFMAIRNLIAALWTLLPYKWLTIKKIGEYLIYRGLARIYMLGGAEKVMKILTQIGVINHGLVRPPADYSPLFLAPNETVIIVGSGISGLSAANHLMKNGIKTVVLETKSRIGGRILDVNNLAHGAHVVHGLTNNPLTFLCHQARTSINEVSDVVLISLDGSIISDTVYENMEHLYSGIMNGALEWAKEHNKDASWYDTITKNQKEYNDKIRSFTSEEDSIFSCILNLKEIEQRAPYKRLTLLNHEYPKVDGADGSASKGLYYIIESLADGVDIQLETKVTSISLENDHVNVRTNQGTLTASRVIITVPLAILKAKKIKFEPPLPGDKWKCISELGCYSSEKIFLQFPSNFWAPILKDGKKRFTVVTSNTVPFQSFEDVTIANSKVFTLVSYLSPSSYDSVKNKSDRELKEVCVEMLRRLFSNLSIEVPEPSYYFVTRWSLDPDIQHSGSCVEVGSSYSLYDTIAEELYDKLFFAGEATYRRCPNSVAGAYLSGLREANKILNCVSPIVPLTPASIIG